MAARGVAQRTLQLVRERGPAPVAHVDQGAVFRARHHTGVDNANLVPRQHPDHE